MDADAVGYFLGMSMTFLLGFLFGIIIGYTSRFKVIRRITHQLKEHRLERQERQRQERIEKTPKCPMDGLPVVTIPLEGRITSWSSAVESGKYRGWYPVPNGHYHDWKKPDELRRKAESVGERFVPTSIRAADCYQRLDKIYKAGIYPDGCRYLTSSYYYGSKEITRLYEAAKRLLILQETVDESQRDKLDATIGNIQAAVDAIVTIYFENELAELIKLAIVKELKANDIEIESAPELPAHATKPEEIERLKFLVDSLLDGSRGKQPVLISEV